MLYRSTGYADDLTLISPSLCAMNQMLSICKSFAAEYNDDDKVYLDGTSIKWVDHINHLGDTVTVKLNYVNDCDFKRCLFNASVNKVLGIHGGVQTNILCKLVSH